MKIREYKCPCCNSSGPYWLHDFFGEEQVEGKKFCKECWDWVVPIIITIDNGIKINPTTILKNMVVKRNKLSRQIATLKKANLKQ